MKFAIVVPDGMADRPLERLGGRTPLEAASTPAMDRVARCGRLGLVRHTYRSLPAGSDVAMLSVLGYDPGKCYTGRAPLEAASMGVELGPGQVAYRCNLVTVDEGVMADHSGGHISTREAEVLVTLLNESLGGEGVRFYTGVGYRHLMLYVGPERLEATCTPPHDILEQPISRHLPRGRGAKLLRRLMEASREILTNTDINEVRIDLGENPANMIWLWGGGTRPDLVPFERLYGKRAAVVAAVDLVRGLAVCSGLEVIEVEGATGDLHTNYEGKGQGAIAALEDHDMVIVHVEAPDEASHLGDIQAKVDAIEAVDRHVVAPLLEALEGRDYRLLVLPDHPTPIETRTHAVGAVPFALCGSDIAEPSGRLYTEANAAETGLTVEPGHRLMEVFLGPRAGGSPEAERCR